MFALHRQWFARLLAALAVVGLLLGGATTTVMAMPLGHAQTDKAMAMAATNAMAAMPGMDHRHAVSHSETEQPQHAAKHDCCDDAGAPACNPGTDCCPHGATGLPPQCRTAAAALPKIFADAPQWRPISVTPVTEIRPPITTL